MSARDVRESKITVRGVELSNPPDKLDWNYDRTPLYLYVVEEPRLSGRYRYPPLPFRVAVEMLVPEILRRRKAQCEFVLKGYSRVFP